MTQSVVISSALSSTLPRRARAARIKPKTSRFLWSFTALVSTLTVCFGLTSLVIANLTLHLQQERLLLRTNLQTLEQKIGALNETLAERQNLSSLRAEAERLGLVASDEISFLTDTTDQLTRQ